MRQIIWERVSASPISPPHLSTSENRHLTLAHNPHNTGMKIGHQQGEGWTLTTSPLTQVITVRNPYTGMDQKHNTERCSQ